MVDDAAIAIGPLAKLFGWARSNSLVALPFVGSVRNLALAEFTDWARVTSLGSAPGSGAPTHADLLVVVGDISQKLAPILQRTWARMAQPSFAVHVSGHSVETPGADGYATVHDLSQVIPLDVVIDGCPPDPATLAAGIDALGRAVFERTQTR